MTSLHVSRINTLSFTICLISILTGIVIGSLGIWEFIPAANGLLWRALATCGVFFVGSVLLSLSIRCFKTNA